MDFLIDHRDNTSTVVRILEPEQLNQLDLAIITRKPPTFTACYEQFELKSLGISFDAFYRYARRLRTSLRAKALAQRDIPAPDESEAVAAQLVSQRMVEALLTQQVGARTLHRLADAYRMTAQIELQRRRLDIAEETVIRRIGATTDHQPLLPAAQSNPPTAEPADDEQNGPNP
ncbi:MAG: hypothetical protein HZA51_13390 [Planctomycetes bacterium]|nr:hypothetical protein [Planctomycetota bacterium]